ncbi:hypothetical protein VTL71DRAFT_13581 [Oculimacula yallundae]|uniref:D-xylulose reductase n=1 Tax=Oculimacula yallundae TaxID=86028 RepID=A0ABR4CL77_9HELO
MTTLFKNPSCYLYGPGVAKIEEAPYPVIEDQHDIVVRIAYVGVCGSDVHFWNHGGVINKVNSSRPLIMGHEASGTIHAIGTAVTSLQLGDRVAIEPGQPCRRCETCKAGHYNLCLKMKFAADPPYSHGTLTKFFKISEDFCYKLPASIGLKEGVLVEPLAVAVHAARLAYIKAGQSVVVFGAGTVGLLCAAVARAMERFAGARTHHPTSSFAEENSREILRANDLSDGVDVVLEATGASTCIETGIFSLKAGGSFVQVGLSKSRIEFPLLRLSEKEINLKGCFRYNAGDYSLALHFLESGKISLGELITYTEPFERATDAWERTKGGEGIKTLIQGPQD